MITLKAKKGDSNVITVPKPKERLHWAPRTKKFENKKRKLLLSKFKEV